MKIQKQFVKIQKFPHISSERKLIAPLLGAQLQIESSIESSPLLSPTGFINTKMKYFKK